jgi:hypothetical protein
VTHFDRRSASATTHCSLRLCCGSHTAEPCQPRSNTDRAADRVEGLSQYCQPASQRSSACGHGMAGRCMRAQGLPAVGTLAYIASAFLVHGFVWAASEKRADDEPSCDWTMVPHRNDFRVLSSSNGAPTSWQFGDDHLGIRVSRTYHSDTGLGHPCWDQTLRFESVDGNIARQPPVPSAVAGVVISGATEAVLGGLAETSSDDTRVRWTLTEGRAPDASQGSSSTSTSSTRVGNSHRWTYWLSCSSDDDSNDQSHDHAIATVETTASESAASWTLRVRFVRACPGVWSHLAVNVAPPVPSPTAIPHPLSIDEF